MQHTPLSTTGKLSVRLYFPTPPSTNGLYYNVPGKGRRKTSKYRKWIAEADKWILTQGPVSNIIGRLCVAITIPENTRGDPSNRIKALEDYLVSREITGDDKNNWRVSIEKSGTECYVEIAVDKKPDMG